MPPAKLGEAVLYWLKLGFISFGGPAGQISMMHQELVERRRWISENRFLHALNFTMVLPGPEAQQLATYIGWLMHGVRGGIIAGTLFVLPSFFIIVALAWIYLEFGDVPVIAGLFYGIKAAITAVVVVAAIRIGSRALTSNALRLVALGSFLGLVFLNLPFPVIVLGAALIGLIGSRFAPQAFKPGGAAKKQAKAGSTTAWIGDDTAPPAHTLFSKARLLRVLGVGLLIWLLAMGFLIMRDGWDGTLTTVGAFFSKMALVTFGGAYAALDYIRQAGVEHYEWLTAQQMMDGLALGETTPGPLIMVVTFVGFVGGWTKEVFGPGMLPLAGIAAAGVATFFTFLPSFMFILIGGPAVEASRRELKLTAPLAAVTAAVVGVILNLAVFFGRHVLWPEGFGGRFDIFSAVIAVAALIAMLRFKVGIVPVIAASAVAGLLWTLAFA